MGKIKVCPEQIQHAIMDLNDRLVSCAMRGSWGEVSRLETERRTLLQSWMKAEAWTANALIVKCVQHSVEVDRKVVRLKFSGGHFESQQDRLPSVVGCHVRPAVK